MIAAALVAGIAPGDAETGDHRAGIGLVEMGAQHDCRDEESCADRIGQVERGRAVLAAMRLPLLSIEDLLLHDIVEGLGQAGDREGRRRFGAAAEAEGQDGAARQLAGQSDIARPGDPVFPAHRAVTSEILPAIAGPDIAGAGPAEGVPLAGPGGGEGAAKRTLLSPQNAPAAVT